MRASEFFWKARLEGPTLMSSAGPGPGGSVSGSTTLWVMLIHLTKDGGGLEASLCLCVNLLFVRSHVLYIQTSAYGFTVRK